MSGDDLGIDPPKKNPPRKPFQRGGDNVWVSTAEKILTGCMVILVLGFVVFAAWTDARFNHIHQASNKTTSEALENRAVACRVLLALDQPLDPNGSCYQSEVLAFYNPNATVEASLVNANDVVEVICSIADMVGVEPTPEVCMESRDGG